MYNVSFLDMTCRSKEFNSFLRKCLTKNPETRSSATELLQHPFVASVSHHKPLRALYQVSDMQHDIYCAGKNVFICTQCVGSCTVCKCKCVYFGVQWRAMRTIEVWVNGVEM